jgi:hypothetical protein
VKKRLKKILTGFLLFSILFGQAGSLPMQEVRAASETTCENESADSTCGTPCLKNGTYYKTQCEYYISPISAPDHWTNMDRGDRCDGASKCYMYEPIEANISCEWREKEVAGIGTVPVFCASGFNNEEHLRTFSVEASCIECFNYGAEFYQRVVGARWQSFPFSSTDSRWGFFMSTPSNPNRNISLDGTEVCVGGHLDQKVIDAVEFRNKFGANAGSLACGIGTVGLVAGEVAGSVTSGGVTLLAVGATVTGGAACIAAAQSAASDVNNSFAEIKLRIRSPIGGYTISGCEKAYKYSYEIIEDLTNGDDDSEPYSVCKTNLDEKSEAYANCVACFGSEDGSGEGGIWTAVGCIDKDPKVMIGKIINVGIGIAGGIALLMILASAFMLTISQGDVKKTSDAKERLTSAIIGLIFIIFSVTILQFIGESVLKIPGFGGG